MIAHWLRTTTIVWINLLIKSDYAYVNKHQIHLYMQTCCHKHFNANPFKVFFDAKPFIWPAISMRAKWIGAISEVRKRNVDTIIESESNTIAIVCSVCVVCMNRALDETIWHEAMRSCSMASRLMRLGAAKSSLLTTSFFIALHQILDEWIRRNRKTISIVLLNAWMLG